ncbi:hypothetical protein PoB_002953700, partial [Plakobranchus ocellatus]
QKPSMKVIANSSSFTCHKEFLVVDEDFATFEVEVSGNSPDYIYDEFDGPRFRIQELVMEKGTIREVNGAIICVTFERNAACVKRDIVNKTYCSCEQLGPYVYRVKTVYKIDPTKGKRQGLQLLWPSIHAPALSVVYHLPEIRGFDLDYVCLASTLNELVSIAGVYYESIAVKSTPLFPTPYCSKMIKPS